MITPYHIELHNISKRFGGVQALADVTLSVNRGVVHALVGENGAGKSTLGKIISGVILRDSGELIVNGTPANFNSPRDASAAGIAMVQQEITLVPKLSVLKNVFLGIESNKSGLLNDRQTLERYKQLSESTGFTIPADRLAGEFSVADQKKIEILKALARDAKLIVMDEPTATLTDDESKILLDIVRRLRDSGTTIIYVSHFLKEVLSVADEVTVLRNGELIQTTPANDETPQSLVKAMLGRTMSMAFPPKTFPTESAEVVFSVENISAKPFLDQISFHIRAGEIVALAGLVGSGRTEIARAIFGADRKDGGTIKLGGREITIKHPADAVKTGIAMLPENRKAQGLHLRLPNRNNVSLPHLNTISRMTVLNQKKELNESKQLLQELDVRPPDPKALVNSLSGGNQQKVLFGKWLYCRPRLFIADEPTHGVDVGAKLAIYQLITSLASEGMGVLLISSEIEEIIGLAHRVLIVRQGRIVAEFKDSPDGSTPLTEDAIMHAAFATE